MIKILVYDTAYAPAASTVRTSVIIKIKGWLKKGAKVTFICSTEAKLFYKEKLPGVKFITFPFTWKSKTRWTVSFEFVRTNLLIFPYVYKTKGKFDIIYSHTSTLDMIFFPIFLKMLDKKVRWFAVVDNIVPKPSDRPGNYVLKTVPYIAFVVANKLLERTDGIFVVTNLLKDYYEERGVRVIKTGTGNGLDIDSFTKDISPNTPRFAALFGGRIHPAKGIFDLVDITEKVSRLDKNFTLGIMGDGEEYMKNKLKTRIKQRHLTKKITLVGYMSTKERWDLYRCSEFFLFPSYAEGCPQVVLEAFAANKLVIGYDLPEYRDAFKKYIDSGQLVIFNKGDVDAIAKYILSIKNKRFSFHNKLSDYSWGTIVANEWKVFSEGVK